MTVRLVNKGGDATHASPLHADSWSSYWRRNRSTVEAEELSFVLRAVRKVAGHIGQNVRPVHWLGITGEEAVAAIRLDPGSLRGTYPVRGPAMDRLVGQVAREAYRDVEWSVWVENQVRRATAVPVAGKREEYLVAILGAAEDIYLAEIKKPVAWTVYLQTHWRDEIRQACVRDPTLPPSPASLAAWWRSRALFGQLPEILPPYYDEILQQLRPWETEAAKIAEIANTATRRELRAERYAGLWATAARILADWDGYVPVDNGVAISDDAGPRAGPQHAQPEADSLPEAAEESPEGAAEEDAQLRNQVRSLTDDGRTDLTHQLAQAAGVPADEVLETISIKGTAKCTVVPDSEQVRRLRRIFREHEIQSRRRTHRQDQKFMACGEIDPRRLHRVVLDGKAFKIRRFRRSKSTWSIAVAVDASGSMSRPTPRGRPWRVAERTFAALAQSAKGSGNRIRILAYREQNGRCLLSSILEDGQLYTVDPAGETPSGQGILAAAMSLRDDPGNRLVIHITDGEANRGVDVGKAIAYCREQGIDLITIGSSGSPAGRRRMLQTYGSGLHLIDDIAALPEGLESLMRERLLHGRR